MSSEKLPSRENWSVLAFIRFFLGTTVMISHLYNFAPDSFPFGIFNLLGGKAAVIGFLIISGFSIGSSYISSSEGYFKRRFLRIYPLYVVAVLFTIYVQYLLGSPYELPLKTMVSAGVKTSIANIFLLQGFIAIPITYNGPLWSLSIEVFFYILAPLLFRINKVFYGILILASLYVFSFVDVKILFGATAGVFIWAWLIGFMISARKEFILSIPFLVLGGIAVFFNKPITHEPLSILTYAIVIVALILCIKIQFRFPAWLKKIFNYLGELSYPLYLYHFPLYLLFYYLGVRNVYLFVLLVVIVIIPINYVFDKLLRDVFWVPLVNIITEKKVHVAKSKRSA